MESEISRVHLSYDEDLIEAVVFLCASGRRKGAPSLQIARYHREREKLYALPDPEERNGAFFKLHLGWFRGWGLDKLLTGVLDEFPLLSGALNTLAFCKARDRSNEGAELYINDAHQRNGVVALRAERFELDALVVDFLRHELTHLNDMLDPAFGYSLELPLPGGNSAWQRLTRERYRLLWDLSIDARLSAAGRTPMASREQHRAGFAAVYSFWPEARQAEMFERLWQNPSPRHADLLKLASDPRPSPLAPRPPPLAGMLCPLCGFPAFDWAEGPAVAPAAVAKIQTEFPRWTLAQGICRRCAEIYEAATKPG